eukprot:8205989-Ditylum_brightwellii.AAC.1
MERAAKHKAPAATSSVLSKDKDGKARQENWNYRSIIGMLNFLLTSMYLLTIQERNVRPGPVNSLNLMPDMNRGFE